jgi:predicted Zn-dependent protease
LLEGQAQHALGREADSLAACQKAAERECPYPALSLSIASQLLQLDHPQLARQVLSGIEKPMAKELSYWLLLFQAGDRLKDADLMVKAGAQAYALAPKDPRIINNYAAALLIARQNPDQAIKLTVQLLSANPESLVAVVNHGAALLMNDRPVEAEELLHRVQTNVLNRTQLTLYKLDQFEAYLRLHQYDRAWSVSDQIETDLLYPTQQHWFKQARQQLPPRQKQG